MAPCVLRKTTRKNWRLAFLLVAAGLVWQLVPKVFGQGGGSSYSYTSEPYDGSSLYVSVYENTMADFTAYKAENDARIDAWYANPSASPLVDGESVRVTFYEPKSIAEALQLLGATNTAIQIDRYRMVGTDSQDRMRFFDGFSSIDASMLSGQIFGPECDVDPALCNPIIYTGIIDIQFRMIGGLASLRAMRNSPEIFVADSTGIEVINNIRLSQPGAGYSVMSLPSPMYAAVVTIP